MIAGRYALLSLHHLAPVAVVVFRSRFDRLHVHVQGLGRALSDPKVEPRAAGQDFRLVLNRGRSKGGVQEQVPCDGKLIHPFDDPAHLLPTMLSKRGDGLLEMTPQPHATNKAAMRLHDDGSIDRFNGCDVRTRSLRSCWRIITFRSQHVGAGCSAKRNAETLAMRGLQPQDLTRGRNQQPGEHNLLSPDRGLPVVGLLPADFCLWTCSPRHLRRDHSKPSSSSRSRKNRRGGNRVAGWGCFAVGLMQSQARPPRRSSCGGGSE